MAQADHPRHFAGLRLDISADLEHTLAADEADEIESRRYSSSPRPSSPLNQTSGRPRPPLRDSETSQETIRGTSPISIPTANSGSVAVEKEVSQSSYMNHYMRNRQPSISFNDEIRLDSGQTQSMREPLQKPVKVSPRGRSLLQAISDENAPSGRSHSESDRSHYHPVTGRPLSKYSSSPPKDEARIGEGRFPLLQSTVDALARESQTKLPQALSMTSDSTLSPTEEARTPRDDESYLLSSPNPVSPLTAAAFSYEEPKAFRRTASQRWREGQAAAAESAQDFFSRAGSRRKSTREAGSGRLSRRDTSGSTRSLRSAASSYLRAFSMSSSTNGDSADAGLLACDAEGQTVGEDYVLGKQIGYGGFSTIKEVTQLQDDHQRKLAVKIVRRNIEGKSEAENEQAQAEFEHEVELWRFLNHPNILPLEAVYKLDEATFCFIPLNNGGTLFDLVRANRAGLAENLAKSYSYQLASALRYLHLDARVVHRDVKLENCLLDTSNGEPGLVRLCDFGMAEWLSSDAGLGPASPDFNSTDRPPHRHIGPAESSSSAFAGGSLEYAAPEILRIARALEDAEPVERAIISPAVDIWALGVCIYSMVVGSRPFQNSFQPRVVMAILAGDWDREKLQQKGGDDVLDLVAGCLEMDDRNRWDITRVMAGAWFEELASQYSGDELPEGARGWRL